MTIRACFAYALRASDERTEPEAESKAKAVVLKKEPMKPSLFTCSLQVSESANALDRMKTITPASAAFFCNTAMGLVGLGPFPLSRKSSSSTGSVESIQGDKKELHKT